MSMSGSKVHLRTKLLKEQFSENLKTSIRPSLFWCLSLENQHGGGNRDETLVEK